ncbi:MAG: type II toxin-antitoxin system VapC family toxin [Ignavibacteria bacterium]|nr:type II toxin-antitoxin system VapC family toxin [Ignavibacteria bacterium]
MKYLVDTNICIYIIKKKPEVVIKRFTKMKPDSIGISVITLSELLYGVSKSSKPDENIIALEQFILPLSVVNFTKEDAISYGKLRAKLEMNGNLIGAMDMLIASQALSRGLILVTNNEREFIKIEGLSIENWI